MEAAKTGYMTMDGVGRDGWGGLAAANRRRGARRAAGKCNGCECVCGGGIWIE